MQSVTRGYRDDRSSSRYPVKELTISELVTRLPVALKATVVSITEDFRSIKAYLKGQSPEDRLASYHIVGKVEWWETLMKYMPT